MARSSKKSKTKATLAPPSPARSGHPVSAGREVGAVLLWCAGLLTSLALISYCPADVSLNASGASDVSNWIGPLGAYWADMLLQALGVGAYALGLGLILAGWRSIVGRRIRPGFREVSGVLLLCVCGGAFAHLLLDSGARSYPPGGVAGAILATTLREQLAATGAFILGGALVLVSLIIAADGILWGAGLRGIGALYGVVEWVSELWTLLRERHRRLLERRASLRAQPRERVEPWTLGDLLNLRDRKNRQQQRVSQARERGQAMADAKADKDLNKASERALRDDSEPEVHLDKTLDLAAEEAFELGEVSEVVDSPTEQKPGAKDRSSQNALEDRGDLPVPANTRAAEPELGAAAAKLAAQPASSPQHVALSRSAAPEESEPASANGPGTVPANGSQIVLKRRQKVEEPQIVDVRPDVDVAKIEGVALAKVSDEPRSYGLPPATLLDYRAAERAPVDQVKLKDNALRLTKTLKDYGIDGHVHEIRPGPVVTMYEYVPGPGIKLSKIAGLADDLAMSMKALRVRIVAPIPGKGAVGIEIPNDTRETVYLKEIIAHDAFRKARSKLTVSLGKDIEGKAYVADLARMPHLLVAGATGAGKSVSINAMIMSLLFQATPEDVRLIMVDPKMLELSVYEGVPHLLLPVVTDPKKAALALRWAVEEMERRYQALSELGVRSVDGYNKKVRDAEARGDILTVSGKSDSDAPRTCEPLPRLVVIVDELADLMMVASRDVETSIMRLAQMARAAGIHLILATQRPSVDVITGVIKANFPTRIAFQVASKHDSRTIIDLNGAEHLLGRGDMLYLSPGVGGLVRIHGAFVSDQEIEKTVAFWRDQGTPEYDETILAPRDDATTADQAEEFRDEMYDQAVAIVAETRQASISMIQRRLRIGYNRSARLVERMELEGIVGPSDGAKPREVLVSPAPM